MSKQPEALRLADLLEALKQADRDFKSLGFDSDGTYRAHIRAAIAKAGGEV